ncbi:invasin, partial [Escherichia coli M056]
GNQCHQPDGGSQCSPLQPINSSSQSQNVTFIADVSTAKIADLVVIKDGSEADGSTANTLQVKVTDANGNTLAGQTVSVLAGNSATVTPTVTTKPDGTVEISVTSQTAGISAVTASINSSSQSRNVTFIADVRTAKIAIWWSLRTTQWQMV